MKISLITVTYNSAQTLQDTISSVAKQEYPDIEYIVVDGSSKDNTVDIIRRNESTISNWVSEPDKGMYDAMNKGIDLAEGKVIGIINSDDWYEKEALQIVSNFFHGNKGGGGGMYNQSPQQNMNMNKGGYMGNKGRVNKKYL